MEQNKELNMALDALRKKHGTAIVTNLVHGQVLEADRTPTGSYKVDIITGGGIVDGRLVEIKGMESGGKSTLMLMCLVEAQKRSPEAVVAIVDAEHTFDPVYAEALGLDLERLLLSQPDYAEQAFEVIEILVGCGAVVAVGVDSIAAFSPKAEYEGETGDSFMGLQARLMNQHLRKITSVAARNKCTLFYINQIRNKIGISFGSPETTTGGNGLKFYSSVRLDIRRIKNNIKDGKVESIVSRVKCVKNKTAPPFGECEVTIKFGEGIDNSSDLIDIAVEKGIVDKSGSWYSFGDVRLGQGLSNTAQFIKENKDIYTKILKLVRGEHADSEQVG